MKLNDLPFDPLNVGVRRNPPLSAETFVFSVHEHVGRVVFLDPRRVMPMPGQPRSDIGDVSNLAEEIKVDGQKDPIMVYPISHPEFDCRVEAGHRRTASCLLAMLFVRAEIRPVPENEDEEYDDAFIDNFNREDLTLYDTVQSIEKLVARGRSVERIAQMAGKTKTWVHQYIILSQMNPAVRPLFREQNADQRNEVGRKLRRKTALPMSIWLQIAKMPHKEQVTFAQRMIDGGASLEAVHYFVHKQLSVSGSEKVVRQRPPKEVFGVLQREVSRMDYFINRYLEMPRQSFNRIAEAIGQDDRNMVASRISSLAFHLNGLAVEIRRLNHISAFEREKSPISLEEVHPFLRNWVRYNLAQWEASGRSLEDWMREKNVFQDLEQIDGRPCRSQENEGSV